MSAGSEDDHGGDEQEWRFSVEELDGDAETEEGDDESEDSGGNIAGAIAGVGPLEPGDIDLENALFVLLGVVLTVGLVVGGMAGL